MSLFTRIFSTREPKKLDKSIERFGRLVALKWHLSFFIFFMQLKVDDFDTPQEFLNWIENDDFFKSIQEKLSPQIEDL